jgi:hypothetical protein
VVGASAPSPPSTASPASSSWFGLVIFCSWVGELSWSGCSFSSLPILIFEWRVSCYAIRLIRVQLNHRRYPDSATKLYRLQNRITSQNSINYLAGTPSQD